MDAAAERQILLALLAAVEDPPRAAALRADDAAGLAVARHHRLTPLLDATCRDTLSAGALREACRHDRTLTTARNLLLARAAEECLAALSRRRIDAVLLKGLAYEPFLYARTGARPTGDVDLLVRDEHRRGAFQVLSDLGFEPKAAAPGFDEPDYHEVAWTRQNVEIDLHLALAPLARCTIDYDEVWSGVREVAFGDTRAFLLAAPHAATFHTLHMAIDHFHVPGLYLVDLARLLPSAADASQTAATARAWRCRRAFATGAALAAAFLPGWARTVAGALPPPEPGTAAARIVAGFGLTAPLPRAEQLRRKLAHIDTPAAAVRYLAIQARRNLREVIERRVRHRSPRTRLGLRGPHDKNEPTHKKY